VINHSPRTLDETNGKLWSTNKTVISVNADTPKINTAPAEWANAIAFGPHGVAISGISTPKLSSQSEWPHVGFSPKFLVVFVVDLEQA